MRLTSGSTPVHAWAWEPPTRFPSCPVPRGWRVCSDAPSRSAPPPPLSTPFPGKLPGARGWGCVHGHCQSGGAWHPPLKPGATASHSGLRRHVALFRLQSAGHLFQLSFSKKSEMFPLSDRAAQESLPRPRARSACAPSSAAATGHGRPWSPGSYVTV